MEGSAIQSCRRFRLAACMPEICASTAALSPAAPAPRARPGTAASNAPAATNSRRVRPGSKASSMGSPAGVPVSLLADGAAPLAQHVFLDLARGGLGQLADEVHRARDLEVREALAAVRLEIR